MLESHGSKIRIWKQDPWVPHVGVRATYIPSEVREGPSDDEIRVEMPPRFAPVKPDSNGDFLFQNYPKSRSQLKADQRASFHAAHTFAVARQILNMYQRALKRLAYPRSFFKWSFDGPLTLKPYFSTSSRPTSPTYRRPKGDIVFPIVRSTLRFDPENERGKSLKSTGSVYTCESFDFIAHEMGHAILDGLRPEYRDWIVARELAGEYGITGTAWVIWEALGDLSAILTMLAQMDMVETIVAEYKANLRAPNFLAAIAERYGEIKRLHADYAASVALAFDDSPSRLRSPGERYPIFVGLRNALVSREDLDQGVYPPWLEPQLRLTGAIYDVLVELFRDHRELSSYDPAESLFRVGQHLMGVVLKAYLDLPIDPKTGPTLRGFADTMISIEDDSQRQSIMEKVFRLWLDP